MKLKSVFKWILIASVLLTLSYVFINLFRNRIVEDIDLKHKERFLAFSIADEFRQTSANLTRFARTYSATGDSRYWDEYWNLVDWSSGDIPRPDSVHPELFPGEKIDELEVMKRVGLLEEELVFLGEIIQMSDDLIHLEDQAMKSVKNNKYVEGPEEIFEGEDINSFAVRILYNDRYHDVIYKIIAEVEVFIRQLDVRIYKELENLKRKESIFNGIALVLLIIIVIGIITLIVYLIKVVLNRLMGGEPIEIAGIVKDISKGHLNLRFTQKNPKGIYKSMKQMVATLSKIVGIVSSGSEQIVTASSQLAMGNQDLSTRTEQQATALEETSAAIEQMNTSIRSNADNTITANQLSLDVSEKADEGTQAVNQMIKSMNEISDSSNRISDIIEVINNIAFQTNLLALNASIEAARAGEQGKGFAVVAVEVRKLAKRSDKAASEIAKIIKTSNKKVLEGVDIANTAGEMLDEINSAVKKVTVLIGEISAASQEQLSSVDQIDNTLATLDDNTQKNASLVEEAAAATEELSAQAIELNRNMKFFKLKKQKISDLFHEPPKVHQEELDEEDNLQEPEEEHVENSDNDIDEFNDLVSEDGFKEF